VSKIIRIGVDTSKSVFVLHGVDESEQPALKKKLRRKQVIEFFAKLEPSKVGLEACGASHYRRVNCRHSGMSPFCCHRNTSNPT
jgi:transposase